MNAADIAAMVADNLARDPHYYDPPVPEHRARYFAAQAAAIPEDQQRTGDFLTFTDAETYAAAVGGVVVPVGVAYHVTIPADAQHYVGSARFHK